VVARGKGQSSVSVKPNLIFIAGVLAAIIFISALLALHLISSHSHEIELALSGASPTSTLEDIITPFDNASAVATAKAKLERERARIKKILAKSPRGVHGKEAKDMALVGLDNVALRKVSLRQILSFFL